MNVETHKTTMRAVDAGIDIATSTARVVDRFSRLITILWVIGVFLGLGLIAGLSWAAYRVLMAYT